MRKPGPGRATRSLVASAVTAWPTFLPAEPGLLPGPDSASSKPDLIFAAVSGPGASLKARASNHAPHSVDPRVLINKLDQVLVEG